MEQKGHEHPAADAIDIRWRRDNTIEWIERLNPELKLATPGPADLVLCQP
jgi:hypothetical protein